MSLLTYLGEHHSSTSFEEMTEDFIEKFGVDVRNEDDLFLFKYNMLKSKWLEPVTWECRGAILRRTGGAWKYCSRPFDKFFNLGESKCKLLDINNSLYLSQKADGTLCSLWFDDLQNSWRVSTNGRITPLNVGDYDITFHDLFFKNINLLDDFLLNLEHGYTHLFELCTYYNRIVTKYENDCIFYIISRNIHSGEYYNLYEKVD